MRFIALLFMTLFMSTHAFAADLRNGDRARYNYDPVPVYKILAAKISLVEYEEGYHVGNLDLRLLVEGNICGNERSSLGSMETWLEDNRTKVMHFTRDLKPTQPMQCAEYSKETKVYSKFQFDADGDGPTTYDLDGNTVTVKKVNGRWQATINNASNERGRKR